MAILATQFKRAPSSPNDALRLNRNRNENILFIEICTQDSVTLELHLVRPAWDVDLDWLALLVHGMKLELGFPVLGVKEDASIEHIE